MSSATSSISPNQQIYRLAREGGGHREVRSSQQPKSWLAGRRSLETALRTVAWEGLRWPAFLDRALAVAVIAAFTSSATHPSMAAEPAPVRIAVFDFELNDKSAGGGIIGQDAIDTEHLKLATEKARQMLSDSGRYVVADTGGAAGEVSAAGGIRHCNGCDGPLARKLGADQSMVGVFTRVNRTEYTLQILVRDAQTGAVLSNDFTGLRMGANYAWPRGVKWLMERKILSGGAESKGQQQ